MSEENDRDDEGPSDFRYFQGITKAQIKSLFEKITHLHECIHDSNASVNEKLTGLDEKIDKLYAWRYTVMGGMALATFVFSLLSNFLVGTPHITVDIPRAVLVPPPATVPFVSAP